MTTTTPKRTVRLNSDPLRLERGETFHVGVDVHKRAYHVAVLSDRRGYLATWVQSANPALLCDRLRPIRKQVARVVYEAGPTGFTLARWLRRADLAADVIAPSKVPSMPGAEPKSDRLDCRRLALYAQKGLLTAVRVPTAEEEADRQVVRLREQLVRKLRSAQQQIKAFLLQHGLAEPQGLAHWSAAAVEELSRRELVDQLRFCLDLLLDKGQPHYTPSHRWCGPRTTGYHRRRGAA